MAEDFERCFSCSWQKPKTGLAAVLRLESWEISFYLARSKAPPRAPPKKFRLNYSYSQVPAFDDSLHADPEYSVDAYLS